METIDETAITNHAPLPNQGIAEHESLTQSTDDCRKDTVRQSLLGWESARLWDVQGRIPARSRLVEELLRTSRSGLLGHRERLCLQRTATTEKEKEKAKHRTKDRK